MNNSRIRKLTRLAQARSEQYRQSNAALSTALRLEEQRQQQARITNLAVGSATARLLSEQLVESSAHQAGSPFADKHGLDATLID